MSRQQTVLLNAIGRGWFQRRRLDAKDAACRSISCGRKAATTCRSVRRNRRDTSWIADRRRISSWLTMLKRLRLGRRLVFPDAELKMSLPQPVRGVFVDGFL